MRTTLFMLFASCLMIAACASRPASSTADSALAAEKSTAGVKLSPRQERQARARFETFFSNVTADSIRAQVDDVYGKDAYFNDTLKTVHGRENIRDYLLKTNAHTEVFRTRVVDWASSGHNYYARWVMDVRLRGASGTIRTIGITHLMYDADGRIVFHQDYWDSTAGFFEQVPGIGAGIRWVKSLL